MNLHHIDEAIARFTGRQKSFFGEDFSTHTLPLHENLKDKKVLVIGGSGTIGSAFIKELLQFPIANLVVVDHNENGLAELIRDIRSKDWEKLPEIVTYPVNFGSKLFHGIMEDKGPFHIVANFAAHKHVRSEKDIHAVKAMFENNVLFNFELLNWLIQNPPDHFFCVSTDKASDPVNIMGATKRLMEDVLMAFKNNFKITTSRFANVAFSNGSLLQSYIHRYERSQPLVCPEDIRRFFVSSQEAGQLCLLTCILGHTGEIFVPKMYKADLIPFPDTIHAFLETLGLKATHMKSEEEARQACLTLDDFLSRKEYPVYFFETDTTGEKPDEQFYSEIDSVDQERFQNIAVIEPEPVRLTDIQEVFTEGKALVNYASEKSDFIRFFHKWVPGFAHQERGKYLDDKM